jgi:hypothetical protein
MNSRRINPSSAIGSMASVEIAWMPTVSPSSTPAAM